MASQGEREVGGRYRLLQAIGRGGAGTVWRAEDQLLRRPVAVKEVDVREVAMDGPGLSAAGPLRDRVLREARAAARVSHSRLVTVYDVLEEEGTVFLVQELVEGLTLTQLVERHGRLSPPRVAVIGRQLLGALEAVHEQGIVHRDVKPSNVMVLDDGSVKLADFGIASVAGDPAITRTGMILGSPHYMAPEQATGSGATTRSDLWSLGATLYFAVEGRPPFPGTPTAAMTAAVHDPLPPASHAGALTPVLERLLSKDPASRPDDDELRALLDAAAADDGNGGMGADPGEGPTSALVTPTSATDPPAAAPSMPAGRHRSRAAEEALVASEDADRSRRSGRALVAVVGAVVALLVGGLALAGALGRHGSGGDAATSTTSSTSSPSTTRKPTSSTATSSPSALPRGEVPDGWTTYHDADIGYQVAYPSGWTVNKRDRTRTDFTDPSTGTYLRVDWTDTPGPSPEGAWHDQSAGFGQRYANYHEIGITPTTYKGNPAALWEYTYSDGGADLHAYDLGIVAGRYGVALNFQTHEADWSRMQPTWTSLQDAFQLPH